MLGRNGNITKDPVHSGKGPRPGKLGLPVNPFSPSGINLMCRYKFRSVSSGQLIEKVYTTIDTNRLLSIQNIKVPTFHHELTLLSHRSEFPMP